MLHLHDDVLRFLIRVDPFVKDLDHPDRWEVAFIVWELALLAKSVIVIVDFDIDPVFDVVLVSVAWNADFLHTKEILPEHHVCEHVSSAEIFEFVKC